MGIVVFLPPPPGTPESSADGGPSTLQVLMIVALILGAVVLIAWLLKPLVAKRLRGHETVAQPNANSALSRWNESWLQNTAADENGDEPGGTTEREAAQSEPEVEAPAIVAVDASLPVEVVTESAPIAIESNDDVAEEPGDEDNESADIVAITSTVRTLLERANAGRVLEGFALYSETALQRFRDDMGLSPEEFDSAFDAVPAPPPDQQAELAAITDVERLPDGRIRALVNYGNGGSYPPPEYFTFVPANGDGWLIDEIAAA